MIITKCHITHPVTATTDMGLTGIYLRHTTPTVMEITVTMEWKKKPITASMVHIWFHLMVTVEHKDLVALIMIIMESTEPT